PAERDPELAARLRRAGLEHAHAVDVARERLRGRLGRADRRDVAVHGRLRLVDLLGAFDLDAEPREDLTKRHGSALLRFGALERVEQRVRLEHLEPGPPLADLVRAHGVAPARRDAMHPPIDSLGDLDGYFASFA